MGYIKKLKNNELVGGTDKTTIYPVTSTKAVFEEVTEGNESSFKTQETINKEQQDELDNHEERIQAAEAEDIKSITINGSTKKFRADGKNNVDLTVYTVDNDPEMPGIASNVEDLRNMVGTSTPVLETSHKTRIETLEGDESITGSVENKIKTKVDSINSSYQDDNNEYVKYSMTQTSGEVTNFNIDETSLKNAITSLNTSISGTNIIIVPQNQNLPSTGNAGTIYRKINAGNTYTDYMYSNGWKELATHDTSNEQAQVAYYTCTASGSGAQATKQFVGNGSLTYTPSSGGHIKILMGEANTATGTIYLQFGTTASTKKPLYYNGEPVSASNTWEAGETISVYYDPSANSNTGAYFASNAQGGGGKAERIKYDNSQSGLVAQNVQLALDEVGEDILNMTTISKRTSWKQAYRDVTKENPREDVICSVYQYYSNGVTIKTTEDYYIHSLIVLDSTPYQVGGNRSHTMTVSYEPAFVINIKREDEGNLTPADGENNVLLLQPITVLKATDIVNNVFEGGSNKVLSAEAGKELQSCVDSDAAKLSVDIVGNGYINSNNSKWDVTSLYTDSFIKVSGLKKVSIRANSSSLTTYTFVKAIPHSSNENIVYATGWGAPVSLAADEKVMVDVPSDAVYLSIRTNRNGVDSTPSVYGYKNITDIPKLVWNNGGYYYAGSFVSNTDMKYSSPFYVDKGKKIVAKVHANTNVSVINMTDENGSYMRPCIDSKVALTSQSIYEYITVEAGYYSISCAINQSDNYYVRIEDADIVDNWQNAYSYNGNTIYVSESGNDSNSGTSSSPVKTLARALELTNQNAASPTYNFILDGDIRVNSDITIDKPNLSLRFFGGAIKGSQLMSSAELVSSGIYRWSWSDSTQLHYIFVNGEKRFLASTPRENIGTINNMITIPSGTTFTTPSSDNYTTMVMPVSSSDAAILSSQIDNVFLTLMVNWVTIKTRIQSIANDKITCVFYRGASRANLVGKKFIIENVNGTLSNGGETFTKGTFYHDIANGYVYYHLNDDEDINNITVEFPTASKISVGRASFANIQFSQFGGNLFINEAGTGSEDNQSAYTYGGNIEVSKSANFTNCEFSGMTLHCIKYLNGSINSLVQDCYFHDTGMGSVYIGDSERRITDNTPQNIVMDNCTVRRTSEVFQCSSGIIITYADSCIIRNCTVAEIPYSGITTGHGWDGFPTDYQNCKILKNHIHHIGNTIFNDLAGIYNVNEAQGLLVEGNCIHDVRGSDNNVAGLYLDQYSHGVTLRKNVVYNSRLSFYCNYSKDNVIENNIFANALNYAFGSSSTCPNLFTHNIFYGTVGSYSIATSVAMWQNIFFNPNGSMSISALDKSAVIKDPLFTNAENGDFSISNYDNVNYIHWETIDNDWGVKGAFNEYADAAVNWYWS